MTVRAVHAVPAPAHLREARKGFSIVTLAVTCFTVRDAFCQLFGIPGARAYCCHSRSRQAVAYALHRSQRRSSWRHLRGKKVSARKCLHYGYAHAHALTELVQPLPLRIHIDEAAFVHLISPEIIHNFSARKHVVYRIDAEHQHLDVALFDRLYRNLRVMRRKSNMMYFSLSLELLSVLDYAVVLYSLPVAVSIAVVDHSYIDIVRAEPLKRVLEGRLYIVKIAAPLVLAVLPHG